MVLTNSLTQAAAATDIAEIPGLKELWAETLGDSRIGIAVLDGPVDRTHPSLVGANLTSLEPLVSIDAGRGPAAQHGTHVSSIIFGQHDGPIKGIAPYCRGLLVPVFSNEGANGTLIPCAQFDLARAIIQAVQGGAHIINISGGEFAPSGTAHPFLANAVQHGVGHGVLMVAATGNEGCDCLHIPGALPGVLAVGAMDSQGLPLQRSNWGESYRTQGILAPGENIPGASLAGGITASSGTSYATAIVSGIVALLLSLQLKYGQKPDPYTVRAAILDSVLGCEDGAVPDCRRLLAGRLNIRGAMRQIIQGAGIMFSSIETQLMTPEMVQSPMPENSDLKKSLTQTPAAGAPVTLPSNSDPGVHQGGLQSAASVTPKAGPGGSSGCQCTGRCDCSTTACECSCGKSIPAQLVFALGKLGYDFGTEARRDSIMQHMNPGANNPHAPEQLLAYLEENPWDAAAVFWTLSLDATPIYAIQPREAFAGDIYQRLRAFLAEQTKGEIERVSIPGHIAGKVTLFTGQQVPVIQPILRGMASWKTQALVEAVSRALPPEAAPGQDLIKKIKEDLENFLLRAYEELRNLGITPKERAINYAATNALLVALAFKDAINFRTELDTIEVERSPICRPESDCWDVKLTFFNPAKIFEQARRVYLITIDVSDIVPVMVGKVRSWSVR